MAKYDADELKALGAKGEAFKNSDGSFSYPIADGEDLKNAVHAVGRGNADHNDIRKFIIARAAALGMSDAIPDNWSADGSIDEQKAAPTDVDSEVTAALQGVHAALEKAMAAQASDPDNGTDPQDAKVWAHLEDIKATLDQAILDQAKDATPDQEQKSARVPVTVRTASLPGMDLREQMDASLEGVNIAAPADSSIRDFRGYASVTGVGYDVTDWMGSYRETIEPGAFAKTLRGGVDVPLLFNHDGMPVARTASGTMDLAEDSTGLRTDARLDTRQSIANDLCVALDRGDLSKMSFAFRAVKQDWSKDYGERSINELLLFDTSIVTSPASSATSAALRSDMLMALGREGRSLMHNLAGVPDRLAVSAEPTVESALRALRSADETMVAHHGYQGRGRTIMVAGLLADLRAGKVLSEANRALLEAAMGALGDAQDHLGNLHDAAAVADPGDASSDDSDDDMADDDGSTPRFAGNKVLFAQAVAFVSARRAAVHV